MTHIVESSSFLARTDTGHIQNEEARVPVDLRALCERTVAHFVHEAEAQASCCRSRRPPNRVHRRGAIPYELRQLLATSWTTP